MSLLATLHSQRDAIDGVIAAVQHAQSVGLYLGDADLRLVIDDPQAVIGQVVARRLAAPAPPAAPAARRPRRAKLINAPPDDADEDASKPGPSGAYDVRILACLKLAPPLGMTAKEVVKGVAGKKAEDEGVYQTVWSALQTLARRGRIRKDGRYYFAEEPAES